MDDYNKTWRFLLKLNKKTWIYVSTCTRRTYTLFILLLLAFRHFELYMCVCVSLSVGFLPLFCQIKPKSKKQTNKKPKIQHCANFSRKLQCLGSHYRVSLKMKPTNASFCLMQRIFVFVLTCHR